ncbi:hypothetical protein AALP_AA7G075200 [Arabis alpina]|uniref:FYR C-terminal domain-containing protein n=1 Tax=Arabis alpina TaxID=50452 RepID=A0A087GGJ2_ARAAL|nr:hypothetical protein AALP_AA7G075200 [Arabis alpina]
MASPIAVSEDKKSDDLEIISIGTLYSGSWDKKYWSSSRGKDRFPFPVGYRAFRDHNGNACYIEIEEGAKGPLFLIRYLDESWSGQSPDIAWRKFQKTGFSNLKIWHGKRFTCKMNGLEFFGFKNPLVQRLLRELMTNPHGMVKSSSGTPLSICSAKGEGEIIGLQGAPPEQLHSSHAANENSYLPSENLPQVKVVFPIQETDLLPDSCKSKQLSRFSEELHGLQEKENKPNNDNFLQESQNTAGSNLCAPDTLDFLQDNTISSAPKVDGNTSCEQKEELTLANMVVHEELLPEPNAEDLLESGLNLALKNSDSDSAISMISLLLPQAIPLLKKASSKKPKKNDMSGTLSSRSNRSDNYQTSQLDDASGAALPLSTRTCSGDDENMQLVAPDSVQDFTNNVSITADSFDESHMEVSESGHIISSSKETYPAERPKMPIIEDQVAIVNASLSVSALETTENINPSSHDVSTILEENNRDEYLKKSMSLPHSTSSTSMVLSEKSEELGEAERSLLQKEHHSKNQEPKSTFCSAEGNGFVVGTTPTEVGSIGKEKHKVYTRKRASTNQRRRNRNSSSDSTNSCRNTGDGDSLSKMSPIKIPRTVELQPPMSTNSVSDRTNPEEDGSGHVTEQNQGSELIKVNNNKFTNVLSNEACLAPQDMRPAHGFGNTSISPSSSPASKVENFQAHVGEALGIQVSEPPSTKSQCKENTSEKSISPVPECPAGLNIKLNRDIKTNNEMEKTVELLGCYFHPMPVSSISLQSVGNEIYICVLSFATEDRVRTLFMYKISAKAPSKGIPSVVGHTPVMLPIVDNKSGGNRTLERSYLHFTPDGQHLIFTGNIKTPYCSTKEIDCSCLTCTSACFEENVLRIVQMKTGHVSLVTKLQAVDSVQCVVVCDPNYLIAVVKSGNLIVWAMDSHWRDPTEEFVILANPGISSCIVELKKIPKSLHLVIGHNGIGEFTLWDISKRSLVSRFVSPSTMISEFIPTSLFAWHPIHSNSSIEDRIDMILAATKLWFSKGINNKTLIPAEVKDTAIWLLVCTDVDSDAKCDRVENSAKCWRLALLVRNQVILGTQLDPRANVASTVCSHGVAGTLDGLVYMWDLSSGAKLGSLHDFKGQGVSCISTDDSKNICIASEDGQLLVYCHPEK